MVCGSNRPKILKHDKLDNIYQNMFERVKLLDAPKQKNKFWFWRN